MARRKRSGWPRPKKKGRRRSARSRTRVDLYFDDGSMMSLGTGSPDADALLPIAGELLSEAG